MKVLLDLNVMLDFLQRREPFFADAASIVDAVLYGNIVGVLSSYEVTTLSYFLEKGATKDRVSSTLRWLLETFEIAPLNKEMLDSALELQFPDFEDAVAIISAMRVECSHIITRNTRDFIGAPIRVLNPAEFMNTIYNR